MATHASDDEQHLRLLGMFHYVVGALTALFALFPLIHLTIGLFFVLAPPHYPSNKVVHLQYSSAGFS